MRTTTVFTVLSAMTLTLNCYPSKEFDMQKRKPSSAALPGEPCSPVDFKQMRVTDTWVKYAGVLSWGKGQALALSRHSLAALAGPQTLLVACRRLSAEPEARRTRLEVRPNSLADSAPGLVTVVLRSSPAARRVLPGPAVLST